VKINPDLALTVLIGLALIALTVLTLADKPAPDVLSVLVSTATGALVGRMLPGAGTPPEAPVYTPQLAAAIETARTEQPSAERMVAQPEDRPWSTQ
jgi:hypothetical protein